uniref:biogenesis of lysosome-related organelles complex 1 subunit 1-like n=1 Tax=Styela clava TaxID=7725 RepID=UPI00193AC516|nr:biogenesis of lysosome-related organelles complex 1 subunit 1-like [Styela clava]
MLSSMLKQHQAKQSKVREEQERKRQEALRALFKFNTAVTASVNNGVAIAYSNQCQIDKEMKQLQGQVSQFNRLSGQWTSMLEGFHAALKELGDVENWAKSIEEDLRTVSATLEHVNKPPDDS